MKSGKLEVKTHFHKFKDLEDAGFGSLKTLTRAANAGELAATKAGRRHKGALKDNRLFRVRHDLAEAFIGQEWVCPIMEKENRAG